MKKTYFYFFVLIISFSHTLGFACSMYKFTVNGKTIVGNNEDYLSPNSQFWFEKSTANRFGVMYMGLLNDFAQGAINEKGLVFDGFFEPYLEVNNTDGKLKIPIGDAIKEIMQTMISVEEVKTYLQSINLSSLTNSQLVFVDQSGSYLIVEGDELIIGKEEEKTFSNFYYSQIESLEEVNLDYFQQGQKFLNSTKGKHTFDYCGQAMKNFSSSKISATQYTTIYDLNSLKIRVYLFHDYSQFVEFNLLDELKKGNQKIMIAELFPEQSIGRQHYVKYNNPENPTLFIEEQIGDAQISEDEYTAMGFDNIITPIAFEWLNDKHNPEGAIKVFEFGITLMPNNSSLYEGLGAAYLKQKEWDKAMKNYAKSLFLNPHNEHAITMITQINELRKAE